MAVQVSDFDRFSFTLFMALAVHAIVVLGITFAPEPPRSSAQTMEIALSQFDDEEAPEKADFLAQTSQKGSGTEEEVREMTTPQPAEVSQPQVAQVQPEPPAQTEPQPRQEKQVVQTESSSSQKVRQPEDRTRPEEEPLPVREKKSLMERSLEIASLEARFDAQQQAYARKPRVMRVTAASQVHQRLVRAELGEQGNAGGEYQLPDRGAQCRNLWHTANAGVTQERRHH